MTVISVVFVDEMSPTAEHPVTYSIGSDCMTSSSSPRREVAAGRHAYFPSLYTRGGVAVSRKSAGINSAIVESQSSSPSSSSPTPRTRASGDMHATWRSKEEPPSSTPRRNPSQPQYPNGMILPTIDSTIGQKQYLTVGSCSEDLAAHLTTPPPPAKSWRTSASYDSYANGARLLVPGRRDSTAFSGPLQHSENRRRVVRNQEQTTFVRAPPTSLSIDVGKMNCVIVSPFDVEADERSPTAASMTPPEIISVMTSPVPRSILALNRCHDCATENVRAFINGLDLDAPIHRRPISLARCSRLLPSEAATTVLLGLIDEDAVEKLTKSRLFGSVFEDRKCVHFNPTVRVFCGDDKSCGQLIQQLRPSSGDQLLSTRNAGSSLPPLTSSSGTTTELLPAVVQRYMVRSEALPP